MTSAVLGRLRRLMGVAAAAEKARRAEGLVYQPPRPADQSSLPGSGAAGSSAGSPGMA